MTSLRGALSALAVTALVGAGLAVAGAPAHATVADIDEGGQTTRSMVVERALSWTFEKVPYSETSYWPAGAPSTGVGHSYRQDCSGFLSMAWDLTGSAVTGDFVSTTSAYDTKLASTSLLQPGDMLGTSGHVVLFLGWSADDAGRHRYFDMVSEATTGTDASVSTDQDLLGYWSSYAPYVDKHVAASAPSAVSWGPGRTDQVELTAAGHVYHRWQTTTGGAWSSEDMTARYGLPILRTNPVIASQGTDLLDLVGVGPGGALVDVAWTGKWTTHTLTTSGTVYGLSVAGESGRVDVFGRELDTGTAPDGPGTLVHGSIAGTSFSGWAATLAPQPLIDDPDAVRASASTIYVVVEEADGALHLLTWTGNSYVWSAGPIVSTAGAPLSGTVAALSDGTVVVTRTSGQQVWDAVRPPASSTWSAWTAVPGLNAVAGASSWASAAAIPASSATAPLDVFAATASGSIAEAQRSSTGTWTYVGSS